MDVSGENLPDDVVELKRLVVSLQSETSVLRNEKNALTEMLRLLRAQLFGRKSEKLSAEELRQSRLFNEIEAELAKGPELFSNEPEVSVPEHSRKKRGRKPLPDDLPRKEIIHDLSDEEKVCGCGAELVRIGEETAEKLDLIPPQVIVEKHIRPKYACKNCEGLHAVDGKAIKIAPLEPQILPKSLATPGLLAQLLTGKFCDSLPFYRTERILERFGIELSRATMCNWAVKVHERCSRLLELLKAEMLKKPVLHCDETTLQVLNEPGKSNTSTSYMWLFRGGTRDGPVVSADPPVVWFEYRNSRSGDFLGEFLYGYRGPFVTDGYVGYDAFGAGDGMVHAGCWAHARRPFFELKKIAPDSEAAAHALDTIGKLYKIEREARKLKLDADQTQRLRQQHSRPIVKDFHAWLKQTELETPPKSKLGRAVSYVLGQWSKLEAFLENGHIPIDNNLAENEIRSFVVGRKNWLFSASTAGAAASAALYTLIANAKAAGLEPYWYLRFLFEGLAYARNDDDLWTLLPQNVTPDELDGP